MAKYNWCRGLNCRNMIEEPYAHCSLDCERAEKRDLEARQRPGPQPTLSVRDAETTVSAQARWIANYDDQSGHRGKRSAEATRRLHEAEEAEMVIRAALGRGANQTST